MSSGVIGLIGIVVGVLGNVIVAGISKQKGLDQKVFDYIASQEARLKAYEDDRTKQQEINQKLEESNRNLQKDKTKLEIDIIRLKHQNDILLEQVKMLQAEINKLRAIIEEK